MLCAGNVIFGEMGFLDTLIGLFIAALFSVSTKGFCMDEDFLFIFSHPFGGDLMVGDPQRAWS